MKASEYKAYKGIRKESLRDNMTDNERILDFLTKVKNPYIFKVNGRLVRMRFSENGLTADECLTNMLENLYR